MITASVTVPVNMQMSDFVNGLGRQGVQCSEQGDVVAKRALELHQI